MNNLAKFFPDGTYPSLPSKYGAFLTWMKSAARHAVKTQVTFAAVRKLMETAALEFATDPAQKLLTKHYEAPGARKIERLFKPASFSVNIAPTPPQKRRRLNMNVSVGETPPVQQRTPPTYQNRSGGRGSGRGSRERGNYNQYYKSPGGFQFFGNNSRTPEQSPNTSGRPESVKLDNTPSSANQFDSRPKSRSSAFQGRILNWDNM